MFGAVPRHMHQARGPAIIEGSPSTSEDVPDAYVIDIQFSDGDDPEFAVYLIHALNR